MGRNRKINWQYQREVRNRIRGRKISTKGAGLLARQADVLMEEEEALLWEKGQLGDATPQSILDTVVFYSGLYFALRSGKEHCQLRSDPCQNSLFEQPGELPYLKYVKQILKNRLSYIVALLKAITQRRI